MAKVLVYTSLFPNSMESELGSFIKKRMTAYAEKKNCEVVVVAPVPYFPPVSRFKRYYKFACIPGKENIDGLTVYHPRYPLFPKVSMVFHGLFMYLFSISLLKKIRSRFEFDLIDAHFIYPDAFAAVLLGKIFSVPVIVSARGSDIHEFSGYPLIRNFIRKTLAEADAVISVCQALKDVMTGLGTPPEKITVIPNGVDIKKFYLASRSEARRKLDIKNQGPVLLSVGSLIQLKGHHITFEAVSLLKKEFPGLVLYVIGKGDMAEELALLIKKLDIKKNVRLVGQVPNDQLVYWYNAADVFCLSSAREGWPNVLNESLASGTPAVATNVFGAPEIVTNGVTGYLVNRSGPDIADGVKRVLERNWDRKEITRLGSRRTWQVVSTELSCVFDAVLSDYR